MKQSIFTPHYDSLMSITDSESLFAQAMDITKHAHLDPISRRKITLDVERCEGSKMKLQQYITNSMLKYQGMGSR
jgi:hypothetical protein